MALTFGLIGVTTQWFRANEAQEQAEELAKRESASKEEAVSALYASRMNLIDNAWRERRLTTVHDLLHNTQIPGNTPPFEWALWESRLRRRVPLTLNATSGVTALTTDGTHLYSGSLDGQISLWDLTSTTPIRQTKGHDGLVQSLAVSPDGSILASSGPELEILLWDARTLAPIKSLSGHTGRTFKLAFSPQGSVLASGARDGTIRFWDWKNGVGITVQATRSPFSILAMTFSPSGDSIVAGGDLNTVYRIRVADGKVTTVIQTPSNVRAIQFSNSGLQCAIGCQDGELLVLDEAGRHAIPTIQRHHGRITDIVWTPNDMGVISAGHDRSIKEWSLGENEPDETIDLHHDWINAMVFVVSKGVYASGSDDGRIHVWRLGAPEDTNLSRRIGRPLTCCAISGNDKIIAVGDDRGWIRLFDAVSLNQIASWQAHFDEIRTASFMHQSQVIVTGGMDRVVRGWSVDAGELLFELPASRAHHRFPPDESSITFSRHSDLLLTTGIRRPGFLFDMSTGQLRRSLNSPYFAASAISSDGSLLAIGGKYIEPPSSGASIIDTMTGNELHHLGGNWRQVIAMEFSLEGNTVACALGDGSVRLVNLKSGIEAHSLRGHATAIRAVRFAPDGQTIASGGDDGNIRLWRANNGQPLGTFIDCSAVRDLRFSNRGDMLFAVSDDGILRRWATTANSVPERRVLPSAVILPFCSQWSYFQPALEDANPAWKSRSSNRSDWSSDTAPIAFESARRPSDVTSGSKCWFFRTVKVQNDVALETAAIASPSFCNATIYVNGKKAVEYDASRPRALTNDDFRGGVEWRALDSSLLKSGVNDVAIEISQVTTNMPEFDCAIVAGSCAQVALALLEDCETGVSAQKVLNSILDIVLKRELSEAERIVFQSATASQQATLLALLHDRETQQAQVAMFPSSEKSVLASTLGKFRTFLQNDVGPGGRSAPEPETQLRTVVATWLSAKLAGVTEPDHPQRVALMDDLCRLWPDDKNLAMCRIRVSVDSGNHAAALPVLQRIRTGNNASLVNAYAAICKLALARSGEPVLPEIGKSHKEPANTRSNLLIRRLENEARSRLDIIDDLNRLGALRINCGGEEYRDHLGRQWHADCFFAIGGSGTLLEGSAKGPFTGHVDGTNDIPLYQTERYFEMNFVPIECYKIPLPNGEYGVDLHFAEIFQPTANRIFDIQLEGTTTEADFAPPVNAAVVKSAVCKVEDGWLSIKLKPSDRAGDKHPKISAIEVYKVNRSESAATSVRRR